MMSASVPTALMVALLSASSAAAQTAQPAIQETVQTGLKVTITDDRGVMIEGRVEGVSDQAVRLAVNGGLKDIPVEQIIRIERPDGIENGALGGLGVGVALGTMSAITAISGGSRGAGFAIGSIVGNGVICAGIGLLIDAAVDGRETLYERGKRVEMRVTPIVDRGVRAAAVSLSW
jgi:hypothetical protein